MEVKGTAIKSISEYVKQNHQNRYREWVNALPGDTQKIVKDGIYATDWYPLEQGAIIPTKKLSELFFNSDRDAAWAAGRYSAEYGLKGVYKLYVRMSKPGHIISRAGKIFTTYYRPSEMEVCNHTPNSVELKITKFDKPHKLIEYRIAGWVEKALEMSGCKEIRITIRKSLTKGDDETLYKISWK